ncbi:MAG: hypothetical protein AB8D78_14995 [Akkermansiaceae bacterium]
MNQRKTGTQLARLNQKTLPATKKIVIESQASGRKGTEDEMKALGGSRFVKTTLPHGSEFRVHQRIFSLARSS